MKRSTRLALLLSLPAAALAGGDAVNERIPVDKPALEAHWGVDCAGAWARWQATGNRAENAATLQRELELCGFIYQPPGEGPVRGHPDYRGAAHQLEARLRRQQ